MRNDTKSCPFCGELIHMSALKCAQCGESLGPPARESIVEDQVDLAIMPASDLDSFTAAYVRGTELRGAYLSGMDLFGANLVAADLRGADLGGANLSNADLSGADLRGANLFQADLSDANLFGADLSGSDLTGADLENATYDGFTVWPDGFDPASAGAINAVDGN